MYAVPKNRWVWLVSVAALWSCEPTPSSLVAPDDAVAGLSLGSSSVTLTPITDRSLIPAAGATNVEFDEAGLTPFAGTRVTTQFGILGVTFSDIVDGVGGWTFTPVEATFPGIDELSNLANFFGGVECPGPRSMFFDPPVTAVGFNLVTNRRDRTQLTARSEGSDLGSHIFETDLSQVHFIGFTGDEAIDELVLEIVPDEGTDGANSCMVLDKLVFAGCPDPPKVNLTVHARTLRPPNHTMHLVASGISATDDCDASPTLVVEVTSNEPEDEGGDGSTAPDWQVVDNGDGTFDVWLRAERSGGGEGRVYTITAAATDASGKSASQSATVTVPHSSGKAF